MKKEYSYEEIGILPKKCAVESRNECDITVSLGQSTFNSPVIAANMKSVVDIETCKFLAKRNWFYIMHRFGIDNLSFIKNMQKDGFFTSISIGVNEDSICEIKNMQNEKIYPDFITLDIAHGWAPKSERMIKYIKDNFSNTFLIAGNVCTADAVLELEEWGADAVKIGIAGGSVCITKNKTGFFRPMASTVIECAAVAKKSIIADGGVTEIGHIALSLSLGATMVMCGKIFAGYDQSAGNIVEIDQKKYKEYFGSASKENKKHSSHIEGKKTLIDYKGDMNIFLNEIEDDLKSSCSYAGGNSLKFLKNTEKIII
jgi:GMP reductase